MTIFKTQSDQILDYMQTVGPITPLDALHTFDCMRLGARILDLKYAGHAITREMVKLPSGKRVARYSLAEHQLALAERSPNQPN